jgi:hypothetical protein
MATKHLAFFRADVLNGVPTPRARVMAIEILPSEGQYNSVRQSRCDIQHTWPALRLVCFASIADKKITKSIQ